MKKLVLILLAAVMLLAGCGQEDKITMKVGDVVIRESFIDFLSKNYNTQAGGTVSDAAKKQARLLAEQLATFAAIGHIMQLDVEEEYKEYIKNLESSLGDSEKIKEERQISNDLFEFINYGQVYRAKLLKICEEENNLTRETKEEYFRNNYWRAKHLLLLTEGKTAEEKLALKDKILELYNRVRNGEDFEALIAEYNEDPGVATKPDGYVFSDGKMVPEFQQGVSQINIGEFNCVETSYGYHIFQRLAIDETPELFEKFFAEAEEEINRNLVETIFDTFIDNKVAELNIQISDYTGESQKSVIKE